MIFNFSPQHLKTIEHVNLQTIEYSNIPHPETVRMYFSGTSLNGLYYRGNYVIRKNDNIENYEILGWIGCVQKYNHIGCTYNKLPYAYEPMEIHSWNPGSGLHEKPDYNYKDLTYTMTEKPVYTTAQQLMEQCQEHPTEFSIIIRLFVKTTTRIPFAATFLSDVKESEKVCLQKMRDVLGPVEDYETGKRELLSLSNAYNDMRQKIIDLETEIERLKSLKNT